MVIHFLVFSEGMDAGKVSKHKLLRRNEPGKTDYFLGRTSLNLSFYDMTVDRL